MAPDNTHWRDAHHHATIVIADTRHQHNDCHHPTPAMVVWVPVMTVMIEMQIVVLMIPMFASLVGVDMLHNVGAASIDDDRNCRVVHPNGVRWYHQTLDVTACMVAVRSTSPMVPHLIVPMRRSVPHGCPADVEHKAHANL